MSRGTWYDPRSPVLVSILWLFIVVCVGFGAWELAGDQSYKAITAKQSEYERRDELERKLAACAGVLQCVERAIEEHYEQAAEQYDLEAQERMARYALLLTVFTFFQLGLSGLGIIYVAQNLRQTAESVQLANKAIVVENRPWIRIQPVGSSNLEMGQSGIQIELGVSARNAGHSPAQMVHFDWGLLDFGSPTLISDMREWANSILPRYRTEALERTVFPQTDTHAGLHLRMPLDMVKQQMRESGSNLIAPLFVIGAFYRSHVSDDIHYTVEAYMVGGVGQMQNLTALEFTDRIIPTDRVGISLYRGLTSAT